MIRVLAAWVFVAAALQDRPTLAPEPDAAAQKDTLKKIRDLFKDEYAKKAPADQQALARKLLQSGMETADDPVTKFVLLKEAREVAVAAGDADTGLKCADETSKGFAIDAS